MEESLRLDHWLSRCGYCSRREARFWLRAGRVSVDGAVAADPGLRAPASAVAVDGGPLDHPAPIVVALHKPAGCVTSHDEGEGPTVFELLPERWRRRNPPLNAVGRLDKDTTGLLLLTDDGARLHRWTSPKQRHWRRYQVTLSAELPDGIAGIFSSGDLRLHGDDKPCLPARLESTGPRSAAVELTEGRYHQVKRMFAACGLTVVRLHRDRFGDYELGDLPEGLWRLAADP